jgi:hypothetical protein
MNGCREKVEFKKLLNNVFAVILGAAPGPQPSKKKILRGAQNDHASDSGSVSAAC